MRATNLHEDPVDEEDYDSEEDSVDSDVGARQAAQKKQQLQTQE